MLIVQTLGVIGLAIYCCETYRIRKASQDQVTASQRLIQAAMDQVEGLSKPCIAFSAQLRDGADAILEMHGAVGNLIVLPDGGSYVIHNIGNGPALNLRYFFTRDNAERDWRTFPPSLRPNAQPSLRRSAAIALSMSQRSSMRASAAENTAPRSSSIIRSSQLLILRKSATPPAESGSYRAVSPPVGGWATLTAKA